MSSTLQKKIRIPEEQWKRLETKAADHGTTANRLLVELALEALDRREWPRTEPEIQLLRSSMFAAQVLSRDMIAAGRYNEVNEIRRSISEIAPELPPRPTEDSASRDPNSGQSMTI
ncbi:MAG: hypothetical protein OXQ89_06020 [Rhodospirillaceae bacterium]|nr:hypothetical protein [Rhodospirillaceae bacterium]MDD9997284.1 hypothetical protein [Rhodospirillaceae bacterium]